MKTEWIAFEERKPEEATVVYACKQGDVDEHYIFEGLVYLARETIVGEEACYYFTDFTHWQYKVVPLT